VYAQFPAATGQILALVPRQAQKESQFSERAIALTAKFCFAQLLHWLIWMDRVKQNL